MERKGLNCIHGIFAIVLALVSLLFGGYILVPLFGERGGLFAGVFLALIALALTLLAKTRLSEVFPMELPPVKQLLGSVMMYAGVTMFSSSISLFVGRLFDANQRSDALDSILLKMSPALAILIVAVLPAVCEEFFCRGFLVRCFSRIKNEWVLIAVIGAVFGALHLDIYTFVPTALLGALLCFIAIRTRSLLIPMILHFANNALAVVITFSGAKESASEGVDIFSVSILSAIGMAVFYIGLGIFPFIAGYALFRGKKFFAFRTFVALTVGVGVAVAGMIFFSATTMKIIQSENKTVNIDNTREEIVLGIKEEGEYQISVSVDASAPVNIKIICGDKTLYNNEVSGEESILETVTYKEGECKIIIEPTEDNAGSTVQLVYVIIKQEL